MSDQRPTGEEEGVARLAPRWRWYHFYFLLALLNLVVILTSIGLYHRTLESYRVALSDLSTVGAKQSWVRDLRVDLVELNAPGNDVFQSRAAAAERDRFERIRDRMERRLGRKQDQGLDLAAFRRNFDGMVEAEARIFSMFEAIGTGRLGKNEERVLLDRASMTMAEMDRHQADALRALVEVEEGLRLEQEQLLADYGQGLTRSTRIERAFFGTVILVLAGMFWYGRKLQQTHEQMIADQQRMLEERQARFAAIGEVCSTVAHGIRNPLAGISAAAQVARETAGDGPLHQSLSDIVEESRRLEERARRLLDFASPLQPHFEECDVRNLVPPVAQALQSRSNGSGVSVEMKLPSEAMRVMADPHMITEVLYELGGNALRSMPAGGRLLLEGRVEGARNVLEIADTGCGIPEGVRTRIFELFFTTRPDGNGMGLAHATKMIELQGGRITLDWTGPEGTAFRIELPRAL